MKRNKFINRQKLFSMRRLLLYVGVFVALYFLAVFSFATRMGEGETINRNLASSLTTTPKTLTTTPSTSKANFRFSNYLRGSISEQNQPVTVSYVLDRNSYRGHPLLPAPTSGCGVDTLVSNPDKFTEYVNDAPVIQRDIELVLEKYKDKVKYTPLRAFDYDEVQGLVAEFDNAYVSGDESIVFDCNVIYRPGGAASSIWNIFEGSSLARTRSAIVNNKVTRINGHAVLIASYWTYGYYHWAIEAIMRLAMVLDFLHQNPDVKIISYDVPNPQLVAVYELLELDESRFVQYKTSEMFHVEHLLVPSATAQGRANVRATRDLRSLMRMRMLTVLNKHNQLLTSKRTLCNGIEAELTVEDLENRLRIVIQQRGTTPKTSRHMTNGDELVNKVCEQFPHAIVERYDTKDSVWRMLQLHYDADIVVGPHGAGLSNSIFMREGAGMIEIYMKVGMLGNNWVNPCHEITAHAVGLNYKRVISLTGGHGSAITVDIPTTLSAIDELAELFPKTKTSKSLGSLYTSAISL